MPITNAELIEMLLARLERVPVDSFWAHRASGVRGSLLEVLEREENGNPLDAESINHLTRAAVGILERAAGEKRAAGTVRRVLQGPGTL